MTVLVVDDQERILRVMEKLVDWKRIGVDRVLTAGSAAEARLLFGQGGQEIDILLTDIEMPEEDGISLQKWAAREHPETACIFLTSHADFSYAKEAIRGGVFDYILQPAEIPEIERTVERCIRQLEKSVGELCQPDGAVWARWLIRGDTPLVQNQLTNLLHLAQREGKLTTGYMRKLISALLEALSVACYERKRELASLFTADFTYEEMTHAYGAPEELCGRAKRLLQRYGALLREGETDDGVYSIRERMQEVMRYLDENMERMVSRREAAKFAMLNEDYFSRMFKKETGEGYKEYLLHRKMEYAKRLLASTDWPVAAVASKVGYENFTNFTQMFRKYAGETPSGYRRAMQEK